MYIDLTKEELNDLISNHVALANHISYTIYSKAPHALDKDDLRGLAYEGLVQAAMRWNEYCKKNNYNPQDIKFFTPYADRRMRGSIYDYLRSSDWATRNLRERWKKLKEAGAEEGVTELELSTKTGFTIKEIRDIMVGMSRRPIHLESQVSNNGSMLQMKEFTEIEDKAESSFLAETFIEVIESISYPIQVILALHYHEGKDLKAIAKLLNISESHVSAAHTSGILEVITKMRSVLEDNL